MIFLTALDFPQNFLLFFLSIQYTVTYAVRWYRCKDTTKILYQLMPQNSKACRTRCKELIFLTPLKKIRKLIRAIIVDHIFHVLNFNVKCLSRLANKIRIRTNLPLGEVFWNMIRWHIIQKVKCHFYLSLLVYTYMYTKYRDRHKIHKQLRFIIHSIRSQAVVRNVHG